MTAVNRHERAFPANLTRGRGRLVAIFELPVEIDRDHQRWSWHDGQNGQIES